MRMRKILGKTIIKQLQEENRTNLCKFIIVDIFFLPKLTLKHFFSLLFFPSLFSNKRWSNIIVTLGKPRIKLGIKPDYPELSNQDLPETLAITVKDFYNECYRIANIEKQTYQKRSPLSFAHYINVERVMEEYVQNREEEPESAVNSFEHSFFSDQCIENEEQLKWFLMAFSEVGFQFKEGDDEKEAAEERQQKYITEGNEKPKVGENTEIVMDQLNTIIWKGYLNQYVDTDNQFHEGLPDAPEGDHYQMSFNYIQDHPDETKLKTYDLSMVGKRKNKKKKKINKSQNFL